MQKAKLLNTNNFSFSWFYLFFDSLRASWRAQRSRQVEAEYVVLAVVACVAWKGQQNEGLNGKVTTHRLAKAVEGRELAWEKGSGCSWLPSAVVEHVSVEGVE